MAKGSDPDWASSLDPADATAARAMLAAHGEQTLRRVAMVLLAPKRARGRPRNYRAPAVMQRAAEILIDGGPDDLAKTRLKLRREIERAKPWAETAGLTGKNERTTQRALEPLVAMPTNSELVEAVGAERFNVWWVNQLMKAGSKASISIVSDDGSEGPLAPWSPEEMQRRMTALLATHQSARAAAELRLLIEGSAPNQSEQRMWRGYKLKGALKA